MSRAATVPQPRAPAIAIRDIEFAVAADEQRIAFELVDTVIRDLFGVGLSLQGALPHVSGPAEERLTAAVDEIDRVIRSIRDVVFALGTRGPPEATFRAGDSSGRPAGAVPAGDD